MPAGPAPTMAMAGSATRGAAVARDAHACDEQGAARARHRLGKPAETAINGLDRLDLLVSKVEDLGRRHAGYGVTDAHYESVGAALLWTLEQGLGRAWTPAVASAWTEVYGMLSGIMRNAAARADVASTKRVAVG